MDRRPLVFKWRHFEPQIILCAVRWYLRFSLSYREVKELLAERGIPVDHSTIWRWVQRFAPELNFRLRPHLKPTNLSWRVDETYVRVKGQWCYLYRAIDSRGATVEFFLSAFRDLDAAKSLFRRALRNGAHRQPRVINTDLAPTYASAIPELQRTAVIRRRCRHRPVQYLNNIIEQDHRAIKKRVNAKQGFRSFGAARRTIDGYEAVHMMRKGQVRWVAGDDVRRQIQFIDNLFGLAS
jgi:transposase-like protein